MHYYIDSMSVQDSVNVLQMLEVCQEQLLKALSTPPVHRVVIIKYSKKAYAIFGADPFVENVIREYNVKSQIFAVNNFLRYQSAKTRGWIFYPNKLWDVLSLMNHNNVSYNLM